MSDPKRAGDPCPKCKEPVEKREGMFAYRGRYASGLVCARCKALWNNPEDDFFALVLQINEAETAAKETGKRDPLSVTCPNCKAEAGQPCIPLRFGDGGTWELTCSERLAVVGLRYGAFGSVEPMPRPLLREEGSR